MSKNQSYLSADEVIQQLGINKATLYSYVSRGLLRSETMSGKTRARQYRADDVESLLKRKATRRNPERAAESALQWGDPVLESAITLIENNQLYYRGQDVLELAATQSFEQVAALLWGDTLDAALLFASEEPLFETRNFLSASKPYTDSLRMLDRFQMLLPLAAAHDMAAYDFAATAVAKSGGRILRLLTNIATGNAAGVSIAQQLQQAWARQDETVAALINSALILSADHELNVSSFTARCAASAGSTLYAVINAGLSALQGFRHGGHSERVEALFREAALDPRQTILDRLKRGESMPGFGHPLYPDGDPRAQFLLAQIHAHVPQSPALALAQTIIQTVAQSVHLYPNIDFALVTLAQACAFPSGSPLTIFALGRVAGWVGHATEQYNSGQLIRPRARYIGNHYTALTNA